MSTVGRDEVPSTPTMSKPKSSSAKGKAAVSSTSSSSPNYPTRNIVTVGSGSGSASTSSSTSTSMSFSSSNLSTASPASTYLATSRASSRRSSVDHALLEDSPHKRAIRECFIKRDIQELRKLSTKGFVHDAMRRLVWSASFTLFKPPGYTL